MLCLGYLIIFVYLLQVCLLFRDVPFFSESFVSFICSMFLELQGKARKLHVFIWSICYEQFNKSSSLEKKAWSISNMHFLPAPSCNLPSPVSKLLADLRGAATAQRHGVRRRSGGAAAWCHASASCVIFKSSSAFPKILWTRHHSFAIRSLDATWCKYDCNARHAPDITQWDPPRSTSTLFELPFNDVIPATTRQTKHTQIGAQHCTTICGMGCVVRSQNHYPWEGFKSFDASNFKPLRTMIGLKFTSAKSLLPLLHLRAPIPFAISPPLW